MKEVTSYLLLRLPLWTCLKVRPGCHGNLLHLFLAVRIETQKDTRVEVEL